ncbi:MAG: arsenate reductase ArsC [Caldilineaceae bacterium]|nr:arsenate reductase ArsC [Caldilineaceae bacterium]
MNTSQSKKRVLFLCTGNSCRSQMAEGLVNHFLGDRWQAVSAGSQPSGYVHPLSIRVMAELGIDISANRSKSVIEFRNEALDLVITVCDSAAENCPLWLGKEKVVHIGFIDPAEAQGSLEEKLIVFRQVRDQIQQTVLNYLNQQLPATANNASL